MKMITKKAYMIPETETLSLGSMNALMSSKFGFGNANGGEGNFHAPRKKTEVF